MRFLDYIRSAFKNLSRQKSRTFLTVSAITVGSLSVILMVSLLTGIRTSLIDMFNSMDAFSLVTITPDPDAVGGGGLITSGNGPVSSTAKKLDDAALKTFRALPNVIDATAIGGGIWMESMKLEGSSKRAWPNLIAYEPDTKVFQMPIQFGRKLNNTDMDKIVVGSGFLRMMDYDENPEKAVGKNVIFTLKRGGGSAPDWGDLPVKPPMDATKEWWEAQNNKETQITAEIVGVAESSTFDDSLNYINIEWAKRLMTEVRWEWDDKERRECEEGKQKRDQDSRACERIEIGYTLVKENQYMRDGYGSIILKVNDPKNLSALATTISGMGYGVSTAEDLVEEMDNVFLGIGVVLGIIGGIALFVAAIGIINTMVMATYERIREIGVMRACGATRSTIRMLFTFEAALLGFLGGVFGLILSIVIGKVGTKIVDRYAGDIPVPIDQVAQFPLWLVAGVLAFTTLIGVLSGLYPAVRASRLNPVDALRYE